MSEKYNSSKRPRRFTEEIMSICLCYWRHYVPQFYGASLNSMFKIHFKKVAKYLLCGTEPLMTQFFHVLYARWKRKILAIMENFVSLFWSVCAHLHKWTKTLRKFSKEHGWTQKFSIFNKESVQKSPKWLNFSNQDRIHCLALVVFPDWDHFSDSFPTVPRPPAEH